jgi:hypothetical protein
MFMRIARHRLPYSFPVWEIAAVGSRLSIAFDMLSAIVSVTRKRPPIAPVRINARLQVRRPTGKC